MTLPAARRAAYLEALGIDAWVPRSRVAPVPAVPVPAAPIAAAAAPAVAARVAPEAWPGLEAEVAGCRLCALHEGRTRTVFGTGDRSARWMVVGEAPGAEEDRLGEPFVGAAGQLLNAMLLAIDLPRPAVFIANVLKCRPPNNRDPRPEEVARCLPYLHRQVALVGPRLVLAVGRVAAQSLLGTDASLARMRGAVHRFGPLNTPLIVTYHPAYLLRTPADKRKAWEDLKFARRTFEELGAPRPEQPPG